MFAYKHHGQFREGCCARNRDGRCLDAIMDEKAREFGWAEDKTLLRDFKDRMERWEGVTPEDTISKMMAEGFMEAYKFWLQDWEQIRGDGQGGATGEG